MGVISVDWLKDRITDNAPKSCLNTIKNEKVMSKYYEKMWLILSLEKSDFAYEIYILL